jgi:lipopolysaccharide transport system ATP-binding protein
MDGEVQSSEIKYDQYYEGVKFEAIRIRNKKGLISNNFAINEEIKIEIDYSVLEDGEIISPSVHILDGLGNCILATFNAHSASASRDPFFNIPLKKGNYRAVCTIPAFFLNDLSYTISCFLVSSAKNKLASTSEVLSFTVNETGEMRQEYTGVWTGLIRPRLAWETQKLGS